MTTCVLIAALSFLGLITFVLADTPTEIPTWAPTWQPTWQPTRAPTEEPTAVPTYVSVPNNAELFAIVGGTQCAEFLHYGTATLTEEGSDDGYSYYLKTNPITGFTEHTEWLQIVTDGMNELFRIYWSFSVARTLSDRFVSAVKRGDAVSFRVVDTANVAGNGAGYEFTYTGATWWFSDSAGITATKFSALGTTWGFSVDDGCWGAGTGVMNANTASSLANFWGIANLNSADSLCSYIYVQGSAYTQNANAHAYLYILSDALAPTMRPTAAPTVQVAPIVVVRADLSVTTTATLLLVATMTAAEKRVILNTTATVLQLPLSNVQFSGSGGSVNAVATTMTKATVQGASSTLSIDIVFETVDNPSFATSPSSVYGYINQSLSIAVQTGAFTSELQAQAVNTQTSTLIGATATGVSTSLILIQYPPTAAPTSAPKDAGAVGTGVIVAIVVVVVVVTVVLVGLLSFYVWRHGWHCLSCGARYTTVPTGNGEAPVGAAVIGGYDMGDMEMQVVVSGAEKENGAGGSARPHDASAPPTNAPEVDKVPTAPPVAYVTATAEEDVAAAAAAARVVEVEMVVVPATEHDKIL